MPSGKVKWYDVEKGFGFLSQEEGEDVYVRASALPDGVEALKPGGQRVEFGMAVGRRGPQALSVKLLEQPTLRQKGGRREHTPPDRERRNPEDLASMIEDVITLLDTSVQPDLRRGRYPERKAAQRISEVLRAVARELDS